MERRIVGIDLGTASEHTVRVLCGDGSTLAKRKAVPTRESLAGTEEVALRGAPEGTVLEVVMEPTGPAWLPIAVFFSSRGHLVFRVSSQKASDLWRFFSRHAKSNGIDADALARLAIVAPESLRPLVLPGADRAALDRRVRATDRLTREASLHKVRVRDLVCQLMPMSPLRGDLTRADLAVLEAFAGPRALVAAGRARLTRVIAKASHNHLGATRAEEWLAAARSALELYENPRPPAWATRGASATARRSAPSPGSRRERPRPATPTARASRSRRPAPRCSARRSSAPRTPRASRTPSSRRSTSTRWSPRGKSHLGAICVVAAELAERAFVVMRRGTPYVVRDVDGRPVSPEEAKAIIAERFTVTPEVRARRRSTKVGKAPQRPQGTLTRRPSPTPTPAEREAPVKKTA